MRTKSGLPLLPYVPLTQWIECQVSTLGVGGSNPSGYGVYFQSIAQLGSVPVLGTGGRRFKSCYSEIQHVVLYDTRVCTNIHFMNPMPYLGFSSTLFLLGVWGIFLNRKNIIVMLMSIELMLLAVNFNFLVFSMVVDDVLGQVFSLFILTVAAAESAIGLALLVIYYRARGTVAIEFINLMKG